MEWISVKDRLPEKGFYNVTAVTDEGTIVHTMWFNEFNWCYDDYLDEGEPTFALSWYLEVTHWMPLPQPPTK